MRWELAEEQDLFRESLRGWVEKVAPSDTVRGWFATGDPSEFEKRLADEGWLAVGTTEERGGQGGGLLETALTAEELARRAAPSAAWTASVLALPALPDDVAADVLSGGGFATLVVDAGRPVDAAGTDGSCHLDTDGNLTGRVESVLGADRAARLVVPTTGADGLALHLVDASDQGVTLTPHDLLDRSRSVATVALTAAAGTRLDVDADALLAEAALRSAALVAADSLGAMERMLEMAVDYSLQRKQFGVPIGSFQAVKHAAASMLVSVEAARSIAYFAASSVDDGNSERAVHAAIAKAQVCRDASKAADSALTMHGAIGYTWEHDLHLLYKRVKLNERLYGSTTAWNERIAAALPLVPRG
ncbi:acyl-CoA dehydrogenase [Intrasporangium chromatireducens Q5-1]|uniref:Acyl-CoA dehydrogenase n=1 Tax=Intrasporangium chromatireducens Q5-1 TaxID=584657 RepID=W9GNT6_9MICO|nr:acyl-CoA dehydrogenase [Intrasporangium chromatireducens]EWT07795.1 acyl-CoA dehydrogenase [Intrasporangium chromatireducens Q5-1]